ncbi:unnamed protein product, partial [Meganyctiphanes norvegica]
MASAPPNHDDHEKQREQLLADLLSDVKGCQVRFGGRSELAIELDPRVACLCSSLEASLSHGLKQREPSRGLAAIKQVRNIVSSGLNLHLTLPGSEPEKPVLWWYVRELLTRHEYERFLLLKNVSTDLGRGRAWIRSLLNEHALERYMHILTSDNEMLCAWYEPWSLLRDQERAAMLPNLAAGLDSILFAINIDNCELSDDGGVSPGEGGSSPPEAVVKTDPEPAYATVNKTPVSDVPPTSRKREMKKRKKKIPSQLVSFDEEELPREGSAVPSALNSPLYHSAPTTCLSSPAPNTGGSATPMADKLHKLVCQRELEQAKEALKKQKKKNSPKVDDVVACDLVSKNNDSAGLEESLEDNTPYHQLLEKVLPTSPTEKSSTSKIWEGSQNLLVPDGGKEGGSLDFDASSYKSNVSNLSLDSYQSSECDTAIIYPHLSDDFRGMMTFNLSGNSATGETQISDDDRSSYCAEDLNGSMSSGSAGSHGDNTAMSTTSPSGVGANSTAISSSLSVNELRNAVLEIGRARDAAEEKRREVEAALAQEMEASSTLRAEAALSGNKHSDSLDRLNTRINGLTRENELLKHQLKKYIGAVQLLRRENGSDGDTSIIPQPKPQPDYRDYHEEATAYEGKLIQVAEMHGELMEFNERLQRHLRIRESQVRRFREELTDLRGPLPDDAEDDEFDCDDSTSVTSDLDTMSLSTASRTLVNIWIPTAFLSGTSADVHHVYQIYLRIRDDEWNVYRRYAQFYELHQKLRKKDSVFKTFDFPQKKTFGSKDTGVVEERRVRLQKYLRQVVNHTFASNPQLGASPDKQTLTELLPFLVDAQQNSSETTSSRPPRRLLPRFSSGRLNQSQMPNTPQYNGL